MSHFTLAFHHELVFHITDAFSRDRNDGLHVVGGCVAVREGARDIVDIEYRTLQLRGGPC